MKVRIKLRAKSDWGSTKKGETMTIFNDIFNEFNGIAFFPIIRDEFDVETVDEFSGMIDRHGNEIYETDNVVCTLNYEDANGKKNVKVYGKIVFDMGCFCVDISETDKNSGYYVGQKIYIYSFSTVEIIN